MTHDAKINAAAELADRYIEIILSTKPDLLVYSIAGASYEDVPRFTNKLIEFRQQLINGLAKQPIPEIPEAD